MPHSSSDKVQDQRLTSQDYSRLAHSCSGSQDSRNYYIDAEFRHPLENVAGSHLGRTLLGFLSRDRRKGPLLARMISSYAAPEISPAERIMFWPAHKLIRKLKGSMTDEFFRWKVAEHTSTVRGIVVTARSLAEFGLTLPQQFSAPLFVVWNFTNRCNLRCRHCYQSSSPRPLADELSLAEKLRVVDELGEAYVPMVAFAGGEPTVSPDLIAVLKRCSRYGIHTTVATNGTMLTLDAVKALRDAGVRYVEISLDSVHPEKHDAFRGVPGMWARTVQGIKNVAAVEGIRPGLAMCITQDNYDEVEDMIGLTKNLGATCFAHFNFIPVGRGKDCAARDLTPAQREELLRKLNRHLQAGEIGILSTAPQFGRVALTFTPEQGQMSASHCGGGGGRAARVVAKYLGGCGAGRTYMCLEPNGDVTPCVYMPDRPFGNIRQKPILQLFRSSTYWDDLWNRSDRQGHCRICRYKNYCGGCRARADAYFGSLKDSDPGCIFNEDAWDQVASARTEEVMTKSRAANRSSPEDCRPAAVNLSR